MLSERRFPVRMSFSIRKFHPLFWLLTLMPISNATFANPVVKTEQHIKQSKSDQNQYQHIILSNNLNVILVSDSKAEKSAAALAVKAGANDNPKDQAGLTHFLEHMLFLGTEKYPDANEYRKYINEFGGSNNAYTSSDLTNYFFDIQPSAYEGALDRFSQFFISPLFDEKYTQREKNAVHSEYLAKINSDSRRANQAFKTLFNPEHPSNHFSVGNLETLKDLPNQPLREQLIKAYDEFYYASNMTLVMVANLPLEKMKSLAEVYFSPIRDKKHSSKPITNKPLSLITDNAKQLQFVKPIKDIQALTINFLIPSQIDQYKSKPTQYISYILGQESKNSLYSYLKEHGWITSLTAGLSTDYITQQSFKITINLTQQGLLNIDTVANAVFFNLQQIKDRPINPSYIEQEKVLSQLAFDYHGYISPIDLSKTLASQLQKYPVEDVLNAFQISRSASALEIKDILNEINTSDMLIQVISKDHFPYHWGKEQSTWQEERWYQTPYNNLHLSQAFLDKALSPTTVSAIKPPRQNPYIPEDLSFVDEFDDVPKSIFQGKGIQFWHRADNRFNKPKSTIYLSLNFADAASSVRQSLLNKLWTRTLNISLGEETYLPYSANLNYSLYDHMNGATLATSGYTDKQQEYLLWLVDQVITRDIEEKHFILSKNKLIKDLSNAKLAQAYSSVLWSLSDLLIKDSYSIDQMLNSIESIHFDDLLCFREKAISNFSITGFSNGNKTHLSSHQLAAELADIYEDRLINLTTTPLERHPLKPSGQYLHKITTTGDDKVVLYVLSGFSAQEKHDASDDKIKQRALFSLLKQAIGTNFFTKLRTEKQFGYIVNTYSLTKVEVPALGFLVQSPQYETEKIIEEIEAFIAEDLQRITQLTNDEFTKIKLAILNKLKQTPKELGEDNHLFWREITKGSEDFYQKQKSIETIENINKEEFIQFIEKSIKTNAVPRIIITNKETKRKDWTDKIEPNKVIKTPSNC